MKNIGELLIEFIDRNQNVDFLMVAKVLVVYFILLWVSIVVWVYLDSRKRYDNRKTSILISVFVAIFNVIGLMVYIVLRPEHTREELDALKEYNIQNQIFDQIGSQMLFDNSKAYTLNFTIRLIPNSDKSHSVANLNISNVAELTEGVQSIEKADSLEQVSVNALPIEFASMSANEQETNAVLNQGGEQVEQTNEIVRPTLKDRFSVKVTNISSTIRTTILSYKSKLSNNKKSVVSEKEISMPTELQIPKEQSKKQKTKKKKKSKKR